MSGSEQRKDHKAPKRGAKPPRVGSSLTDAVAAALATVEDKPAEGEAAAKAEPAPAPEAGCAATSQQPPAGGAPPPAVVAPAVGAASAPAMVTPAARPTNGAGFRSGPGSFADLLRRWDSGETAPVIAPKEAPAAAPAAAQASEPPPKAAPAAEPAKVATPAPSKEPVRVTYYGRTDVGLVREHNEDNFMVADLAAGLRDGKEPREGVATPQGIVLAVCDGMGGAAAGEVASKMAVDTIFDVMKAAEPTGDRDDFARRLVRSIEEAGHRIFSAAKMDRTRRGMGTTTTLAGLIDNVLFVGQVGDSRAYVLRGDQLELVTKDQSLVNQLIEAGQLSEEEAEAFEHSNIILQALGTTEDVTVDLTFLELRRGDRLLMCSDGLSGLVHADMIKEVLEDTKELPDAAAKLIQMANAGGGHDNITVILADFDGEGLAPPERTKVVYQQYPLPPDENARDKSMPPREPSMKGGATKPGADVKRGDDYAASAAEVATPREGSGSKMWLFALLAVLLVAVLGGGYLAMTMGADTGGDDPDPTPVDTTETADPTHPPVPVDEVEPTEPTEPTEPEVAAVEVGTIHLSTDVEGGTLYVNDEARGALTDDMTLELAPGAYTLEARNGDEMIVRQTITLEAGDTQTLSLNVPAGAAPPPETTRPTGRRRGTPPTTPTGPQIRPLGGGTSPGLGGGGFGGTRPVGGGSTGPTTAPPNPFD